MKVNHKGTKNTKEGTGLQDWQNQRDSLDTYPVNPANLVILSKCLSGPSGS